MAGPTTHSPFSDRLLAIESRLAHIEGVLGIVPKPLLPPPPPKPAPAPAPRAKPALAPVGPPTAAAPERNVEAIVGGRWFAVLGALATVIGVALFLKLAYDQGWLGRIPAVWRCLSGAAVGAALLIAGEAARRRLGEWAAAGLSGSGIAALYASAFAAHIVFHLIGQWPAFTLLGAVSLLGIIIGTRSALPVVSLLSVIGAYLVPFLLAVPSQSPAPFLMYLLGILALGLSVAAWRRGSFRSVGVFVSIATLLLGAIATLMHADDHPVLLLTFLAGVWGMVHTALLVATRARPPQPDTAFITGRRVSIMLASFLFTSWCVALAIHVLRESGFTSDWFAPLAGVGVTALIAISLCGHLRILVDAPTTDRERLGAALFMQAGALLIAAIAMATSGQVQVFLWLSLGVAAILAARWAASRPVRIYGLVLLAIGTARILLLDGAQPPAPIATFLGIALSRWTLHALLASIAWSIVCAACRPRDGLARSPLAATALGIALFMLSVGAISPQSDASSVSLLWLTIGVATLLCARAAAGSLVLVFAAIIVGISTLRILLLHGLGDAAGSATLLGLSFSPFTVRALLAGGAWLIAAFMMLGKRSAVHAAAAPACAAIGLACFALSIINKGTEPASVAVAWTLLGAVAVIAGRFMRQFQLGFSGTALIVLSTVAWMVAHTPVSLSVWHSSRAPLGLHPGLWIAQLIVAALLYAWRRSRREESDPQSPRASLAAFGLAIAGALFWFSTSLEVARAAMSLAAERSSQLAAVSIWWAALATALIVAGFWRRLPLVRHLGLGLMGLASLKVVVYDLSDVPAMWRVISFLLLGLLMLGVAAIYARVMRTWREQEAADAPATGTHAATSRASP